MVKNIGSILLLTFVLSFIRADEHERRWNIPPELTIESIKDKESQPRLVSFIPDPVTATVGLNIGNNNAHSVNLGAGLDGISLSESNSYSRPTSGIDGSSTSVSKSATVSAGLSGFSTASAKASSNNAKSESHSFSFGQASATSFGTVENGQAITGAASSAGTSQSSTTGGNRVQFSQAGAVNTQYPYWSTWSNVSPNNRYNDQNRPTLTISKPYETRPTLNIDTSGVIGQEQKPMIHIYKWRPNHRISRPPTISIEYQLDDPTRTHGSTNLQIETENTKRTYTDSDLISDFAETVSELFDIV